MINTLVSQLVPIVAIDCQTLNRTKVDAYTCGSCTSSYIGDYSQPMTACVPASLSTVVSKTCPNDCSKHGKCTFFDVASSNAISACVIKSNLCVAKCVCNSNMYGIDCNMTKTKLSQARQTQSNVLTKLAVLANIATPSNETVIALSLMFSASTVAIMTDESINTSSSVVSNMMKKLVTLDISIATITSYSSIIRI